MSVVLAAPLSLLAQSRPALTGTVGGTTGAPIEYATVTLHRAADSAVVKTEFSDGQGAFRLEAASGRYLVSAAQVGFERYWSPVLALPAEGLTLGVLKLTASQATALREVTVKSRKPQFERLADRTIVNVADSPLSAGATTLDVLGRSPGVTLDAGDNLSLRGRQGVLVVIDGKRQPMTGAELADYLRALPAEQLQSIELITNPPVQYDAQGGAGVIAINLKKDQRLGTNGSANASYGRGEYGKFTSGLSLNHRTKKVNVYSTYAYTNRNGFVRLYANRRFLAEPQRLVASGIIDNEQLTELQSHTGRLGLDYAPSKRTTLGISVSGLASQTDTRIDSKAQFFGAASEPTDRYTSLGDQDIRRPNGAANLNLRHAFADSATARSLAADADYARYRTTRLLALNTTFEQPFRPAALLDGDQRSRLTIQSVKVDFSEPLPYRARLEAGAKVTQVTSDNDVAFVRTTNGVAVLDANISNRFRYDENVNAAYLNLKGKLASNALQVGVRAEQTNTLAEVEGGTSRERHYLQLFPSASLQRKLSERHALTLSIARRIDRPSYAQVNPLRAYFDATSYRAGNPDLVPQTSYNFEVSHTYRQKFTTALAYARTDRPFVNAVQPSDDGGRVVVNRDVNLSTQHLYTLTLTAPLELTKWWTLYANGFFYYNRYQGQLSNTRLNRGQAACNLTTNNSFTLPNGWSADLNAFYESREVYGFQLVRPRGQVAAGVQKNLWKKQGTFRLNVADIFYTTPVTATSTFTNFTETFTSAQDNRVVTAAFTYRFGNSKVASARRRAAGAEEELRRAAGQ
ncbi:hypothetical protein BEN47_02610 [Hymenobacter lapidarius]|uniref:Outer membrane protein beta-barrel domain-containing protein n=1 Tax=Hymenobacter lapidarius TaxID=1908237 RepID=A0A1G1T316_9BACT|nr:hypothetical protein BEN47_02610 [Hymenobacter lapidarius]